MQSNEALRFLTEKIVRQQEARPVMMENNTPYLVAQMLAAEANELVESIYNDLDGSAWEVISELADVLYLWLYLAQMLEVDAVKAVEMKIDRNDEKHHEKFYQDGTYEEKSAIARQEWKDQGGDTAWSFRYLDSLPVDSTPL